jgi:hypothetical protein
MTRAETIATIKAALKARSGKTWSVCGGHGTAWGWLRIDVPPARRRCMTPASGDYGHGSLAERTELGKLLGLAGPAHAQGVQVPDRGGCWEHWCQRAQGIPITIKCQDYSD